MKSEQYEAKLEENMKFDGLLRDNLRNSPEKKAPLLEGLKRHGVRMWKIIVGTRDKTVAVGEACP